ncbi:ABC transporter substrate-binding protein [Herbiconiux sp. L3-i23]|uniref:ABC transporter substrate-binding protein n=1 Tax=Herbiconiux sp. L3-i23 TaxID=2905871 RepID=UPI002067C69A|nr:ABC transporter substrate-binding protein [Herbiconiux sp. L3-i23]BDI22176.1 sugar ABC transporter substrate-binding protein [Herbiconiux sp. L3-i23]
MRKKLIIAPLAAAALLLSGCTAGIGGGGNTDGGEDDKTPVEITMWSFFGDREKDVIDARLEAFTEEYPWITVDHVGGQNDDTLLQAVRGGTGPDLALSGNSEAVSSYCSTGVFEDLQSYIDESEVDIDQILPSTLAYTSYEDTRCALPVLADVYGLYYNTDVFAEAGITEPPTTWDELAEDAKALTVFNADGSIQRAGFVPFLDFFENNVATWTPGWDLTWYDDSGLAAMADDPQWAAMLEWQKELVDWYGYDNLQRYVSTIGGEFTAENPFHTGQLAMMVDGEWRVAFAADQAPDLAYATAPIPNVNEDEYGAGIISGTTVGIPRGSNYPEAAWLLARYLATDTDNLVQLTLELRNVPTTTDALADDEVRTIEQFNTMLDIAGNEATRSVPGTPAGAAPRELLSQFAQGWQAGSATDLQGGLEDVAAQIDSQIEQAAGGNAP